MPTRKRLQDVPFGGGLQVRIGRPTVGVDAPSAEQRIKGNGNDGWAITTAGSVIAALPQNCGERLIVAEQAVPQLGTGRVDLRANGALASRSTSSAGAISRASKSRTPGR
jgi:hypothetical protein